VQGFSISRFTVQGFSISRFTVQISVYSDHMANVRDIQVIIERSMISSSYCRGQGHPRHIADVKDIPVII
jgi:hypothetical protein